MANPFPFVAGSVLTAAELNGIGEKTNYTPTFTNLTVGNGTLTAFHTRVQNIVNVFVQVVFGSTTSISGDVNVTMPFARTDFRDFSLGNVTLYDLGTLIAVGGVIPVSTDKNIVLVRQGLVSGPTMLISPISATSPFTWATGDILSLSYCYQAA